ncbi:nucleotide-binding universal stress UspA family protein [Halorubrum alkaliphilum]|uniref:Nucleotide-binding universal stress UspA family protein n=1 Tax=Halorubrum alkaliphilum TaxID=261290 RepID=A0A8T4GIY5_9EURY|nr:universal stress protein [Halorubrum alkaliphilum]MBP1923052.1 nucleotide-binding universal stress UspA family protein [Halorubrum alkaliphilum]
MYDDLLVPTDGSEAVERALDHAIPLAVDHDATLHALYVVDRRVATAGSSELHDEVIADLESQGETAVSAVADRAREASVDVETVVRTGTPDTEIVAYADEAGIDVIVMSPEGKSPRERIRSLGSVSDRVTDDATVPVFLIK